MPQAWRCVCMARLPSRHRAEAQWLSADWGTGMAPKQRAAARGGLQQWRLPVELWQVPSGRRARTEGGCGWHPSGSLAVIPEDIPCRWAIDFFSLVKLWQQSICMQSAGHAQHLMGIFCKQESPLLCSLQSNTANAGSCRYCSASKAFCCACRASDITGMASQWESPCSSSPQHSRLYHL